MNGINNCNHAWKNWNDISLTTSEKMNQKVLDAYSTKVKCSKCDVILFDHIKNEQERLYIVNHDSSLIDKRVAPLA